MTTQPAIYEQLHIIEQNQPWERLPGESAKWHMRFKIFCSLGPKRSVNQVYEQEQQQKPTKNKGNGGSTWYNAVKKYRWWERAEAWDKEQDHHKAQQLRQIAMQSPFVSRPFRIVQLNSAASTLMMELEKGHEPAVFLAMMKQLRELLHDINTEVESWNVPIDASCDAAALAALEMKLERQKEMQIERELDEEAAIDRQLMLARMDGSLDRYFQRLEQRKHE